MLRLRSSRPQSPRSRTCSYGLSFPSLVLLNLLCFQLGRHSSVDLDLANYGANNSISLSTASSSINNYPLMPPQGRAIVLPSVTVGNPRKINEKRGIYGGRGDKQHLGGFTKIDIHGLSPFVWRLMVRDYGIRSVLDVGCGRGVSTLWFLLHGLDTLCVEGSHDAYLQSMLPDKDLQMVEHDFSRGPWFPERTYDAVWAVEFLEHVGRNFHHNYLPAFRKAAIIFATHSIWGGWHHVEVHKDDWWIRKFELYGFKYMHDVTEQVRSTARQEAYVGPPAVNGESPNPQNLYNMLVFFNPAVGALPQHSHLFSEPGCFVSREGGNLTLRDCATVEGENETPLPPEYKSLPVLEETQRKWEEKVKSFF